MKGSNELEKSQNIVLFVPEHMGLGDLFFGLKIAQIFRQKYPDSQIHMLTDGKDIPKLKNGAPKMMEGIEVWDKEEIFNQIANKQLDQLRKNGFKFTDDGKLSADLFMEGPVFGYINRFSSYMDQNVNLLLIPAYNYQFEKSECNKYEQDKIHIIESGLGPNQKGILIDSELNHYLLASPEQKKLLQVEALEKLKHHGIIQDNQTTSRYLENTEISFAYCPESWPNYAATALAVAANQKHSNKNIDLFVAGNSQENIEKDLLNSDILDALKKNGYSRIEFINLENHDKNKIVRTPDSKEQRKTFRILYRRQFSHEDVKNIFKLSHIAGVTGNQSLSEAVSAGVIPVYTLHFQHDKSFMREFLKCMPYGKVERSIFELINTTGTSIDGIQKIGESLTPDIQQLFQETCKKLCSQQNLSNEVISFVKPFLGNELDLSNKFSELNNLIQKKVINEYKNKTKGKPENLAEQEKREAINKLGAKLKEIQSYFANNVRRYKTITEIEKELIPLLKEVVNKSEALQQTKGLKLFGHGITKSDVARGAHSVLRKIDVSLEADLTKKMK